MELFRVSSNICMTINNSYFKCFYSTSDNDQLLFIFAITLIKTFNKYNIEVIFMNNDIRGECLTYEKVPNDHLIHYCRINDCQHKMRLPKSYEREMENNEKIMIVIFMRLLCMNNILSNIWCVFLTLTSTQYKLMEL